MAKAADIAVETPPLEWDASLWRTAITQLEQALPHAGIDPGIAERLRYPEHSVIVAVPIHLDSGETKIFPGYRVQHSRVLGPTNLPASAPFHASQMYAKNLANFLQLLVKDGELVVDTEDEIIDGTIVTRDGRVVCTRVLEALGEPAPETVTT